MSNVAKAATDSIDAGAFSAYDPEINLYLQLLKPYNSLTAQVFTSGFLALSFLAPKSISNFESSKLSTGKIRKSATVGTTDNSLRKRLWSISIDIVTELLKILRITESVFEMKPF